MLERLADRSPPARAAAPTRSSACREPTRGSSAARSRRLGPIARAAAHAWLARSLDGAAADRARAALDAEANPRVRSLLAAVAGLPGALAAAAPSGPRRTSPTTPPSPPRRRRRASSPRRRAPSRPLPRHLPRERRPFGRAGFDVAPLAISGAYDLSRRALRAAEAAGVDLYFWEPGYDALGRFLRARERRDRARVITGTYHADARSIRLDVDRALRTLRRDTLDAFLLFWTRSPARVDAAAFAVLDELRRAGKLRAVGFSTHHRDARARGDRVARRGTS